ncbi:MAG: type II secretion system protein GspM [Proteobacteria bacterium]|nr:type II secretion system protein GspM [Pseudomonadota bacterium]
MIIALPFTLILLGFVIYEYGFLVIRAEQTATREIYELKAKGLEKQLALIVQKPQLEKRLDALKEIRKADDGKIIEGQTVPLAAAALQNTVKGIISSRGGTISSERVEKPEDLGKFEIISVTIDTAMPDIRSLSDAIYAIETQTPFLTIRELDVRIKDYREPRELQVKLKISAIAVSSEISKFSKR